MRSVNLYELLLRYQHILDIIFEAAKEYNMPYDEDFRVIVKLLLNSFYGRACIAANKTQDEYRRQYEKELWLNLCRSDIRFGEIVEEIFEKSYADTDSVCTTTSMMELYGKYQKVIKEGLAAERKEEIHSCIPFIIERIRNEEKN